MKAIKNIRLDYVIRAAIMIAIGVVLVVWTRASIDIVARALAVLLVTIGTVFIVSYLTHKEKGFQKTGLFVAGIIVAAVGAWIFLNPGPFTDFIPKLFGVFILVSGLSNLGQTISLIRYKSMTWGVSLIIAIVTICLGGFLLLNPTGAKEIAVTLIGIFLIVDGGTDLLNCAFVGVAKNRYEQSKEIVDVEAVVVGEETKEETQEDTEE
jgi:uncharacterized membrane protein HdeD (DUF308 family)